MGDLDDLLVYEPSDYIDSGTLVHRFVDKVHQIAHSFVVVESQESSQVTI
jgi:hypothetical protein